MRRVSNIMLRIGMILSIICTVLLVISAATLIVVGVSPAVRQLIIDGVNNGDIHSDLSPEGAAVLVQSMALSYGITCAILAIVCVISAVISSQDLREPTKNRHIACIILGAFSTGLATLGGIFGLIADSQDRRRANNQVDVQ